MRAIIVFAVLLQLVLVFGLPANSQEFPGKGDRNVWLKANELYNEGIALKKSGDYKAALDKYSGAVKMYPYDPDFYNNMGNVQRKLHDYASAEKSYRHAIELKPSMWNPWNGLGNLYSDQKRNRESLAAFKKALSLNPPADFVADIGKDVQRLEAELGKVTQK